MLSMVGAVRVLRDVLGNCSGILLVGSILDAKTGDVEKDVS